MENNDYSLKFCEEKLIPITKSIVDRYLTTPFQVEKKGHGNFVTSTDKEIEKELKLQLHKLVPDAGFIAEESGKDSKVELNWIIDQIDGTTNFIYGLPYAVSVALARQEIGQIILGIIYSPKTNTVYYACNDQGSYVISNGITQRLHVGDFSDNEGIAIFGMPYNRDKTAKIFDVAQKVYKFSSDLKRIGPSSLDICMVAEGKAKLYFELDLNIWDICAGVLILSEAGGKFKQEEDLFLFGTEKVFELYESTAKDAIAESSEESE